MLFNKNGMLCLDELIIKQPTFIKILEDGIVTEEEIEEQSALTLSLLHRIEETFEPKQLEVVEQLLAEMSVLYAIHQYKEIQDINALNN